MIMCKTKKVFFIDSNNRNASSASGTDFTIDLDHPLTLPDGCGVAIDALSLPNTNNIDPIVPGINNKLYCELGRIFKVLEITEDGTDLSAFAAGGVGHSAPANSCLKQCSATVAKGLRKLW